MSEPGGGVKTGRAFVQFDIIASAQGMAFKTRADDVAIDIGVTGVEVTSPRELYMSADTIMSVGRLAEVSDGLETAMGPLFESCLSGYHPHPLYVVCLLGLQARAGAGALRRRSG